MVISLLAPNWQPEHLSCVFICHMFWGQLSQQQIVCLRSHIFVKRAEEITLYPLSPIGNCFEKWHRGIWCLEGSTGTYLHAVLFLQFDQSYWSAGWGEARCVGDWTIYIQVREEKRETHIFCFPIYLANKTNDAVRRQSSQTKGRERQNNNHNYSSFRFKILAEGY